MSRSMQAERALDGQLSTTDRAALHEMRREIWSGGFRGLAIGGIGGALGYRIAERLEYVRARVKLEPKHRFATPLFTGAIGMMLGSTVSARNNAHTIHFILHKHTKPQAVTPYQQLKEQARDADSVFVNPLAPAVAKGAAPWHEQEDGELWELLPEHVRDPESAPRGEWHDAIERELGRAQAARVLGAPKV